MFVFQCLSLIHPWNYRGFIHSGWSLAEFLRPGVWCPSTTPGFSKADTRIAFGQSAPDLLAFGVVNILTQIWMLTWMAWSSIQLLFTDVRYWKWQFHPNVISSILWSSLITVFDRSLEISWGWTTRKGMVSVEQKNERESKERKGRGETREGESSNSCLSSAGDTMMNEGVTTQGQAHPKGASDVTLYKRTSGSPNGHMDQRRQKPEMITQHSSRAYYYEMHEQQQ